MTEWHTPGEEPDEIGAAAEDEPTPAGDRRSRVANPRQTRLLILAGVVIAAVIVLLVIVLVGGGSDGPAKGSPEYVASAFTSALKAGSAAQVDAVVCPSARAAVAAQTKSLLGHTTSASRKGSATVQSGSAIIQLTVTANGRARLATLALSHGTGAWCVQAFAAAP